MPISKSDHKTNRKKIIGKKIKISKKFDEKEFIYEFFDIGFEIEKNINSRGIFS